MPIWGQRNTKELENFRSFLGNIVDKKFKVDSAIQAHQQGLREREAASGVLQPVIDATSGKKVMEDVYEDVPTATQQPVKVGATPPALNEISQRLGIKPEWLDAVIDFESGWDPSKRNPNSSATGLIQFMDDTAKSLGVTTEELQGMSTDEQLKFVEKYMSPHAGKMKSYQDVAMSVFYPEAIGKQGFTFPDSVVKANSGIKTPEDYVERSLKNYKGSGGSVSTTTERKKVGTREKTVYPSEEELGNMSYNAFLQLMSQGTPAAMKAAEGLSRFDQRKSGSKTTGSDLKKVDSFTGSDGKRYVGVMDESGNINYNPPVPSGVTVQKTASGGEDARQLKGFAEAERVRKEERVIAEKKEDLKQIEALTKENKELGEKATLFPTDEKNRQGFLKKVMSGDYGDIPEHLLPVLDSIAKKIKANEEELERLNVKIGGTYRAPKGEKQAQEDNDPLGIRD